MQFTKINMFNTNIFTLLTLTLLVYLLQFILFIYLISISFFYNKTVLDKTKVILFNSNLKFLFVFILASFAGIPPLFLFFFKIVVFLKLDAQI